MIAYAEGVENKYGTKHAKYNGNGEFAVPEYQKRNDIMYYKNEHHKKLFINKITSNPRKCSKEYLAATYLLTSDKNLWGLVGNFVLNKTISFSEIPSTRLRLNKYALLSVAKDMYLGTSHLELTDLCDPYLISNKLLELFITAIRICRGGYDYIGVDENSIGN